MTMRSVPRGRSKFLTAGIVAAIAFSGMASAQEWQWNVAMYAWLTDVGVEAKVNDQEVIDSSVDFGDLLKKVDMGIMLHAEGQGGAHGILFDVYYADLGDDPRVINLPGGLPGTAEAKGDISLTVLEVAGLYNPALDRSGFTLIYGGRMVDTGLDIDTDFSNPLIADRTYHGGGTLYDAMLGARWSTELSERFNFSLRGDVAGGGTEFTWNAVAAFGYELGQTGRYSLIAGYHHMNLQMREEDQRAEVESEVTLSGAFLAFAVKF